MEIHHVRQAESIDGELSPHFFVELAQDSWLEVKDLPTHQTIEDYINRSEGERAGFLTYSTRAFQIGIIKNWEEREPIS